MKIRLRKKDNSIIDVLVFLFIFVSKDTLLFGTNQNKFFFAAHIIVLLCVLVYLVFTTKAISKKIIYYALIMCSLFVITALINLDNDIFKHLYTIFLITISVFFVSKYSSDEFVNSFSNVIYFLACFTIGIFILTYLNYERIYAFPRIINENGFQYSFLGFGVVEIKHTLSIPRMYGIFREPGVYGCFLALAAFIELFVKEKISIKRAVVLAVATIFTFSTGAYIVLLALLLLFFITKIFSGHISQKNMFFLPVLLFVLLFVAGSLGIERVMNLVFNKFVIENSSRNARFGAISANLRMFLRNPFLGNGWSYVQDKFVGFSQVGLYVSRHNTNTFLKYLSVYGGIAFTLLVTSTYNFFNVVIKKRFLNFILMFLWMVNLSNEDLSLNIIFYLLPFYGTCTSKGNNRELIN